MPYFFIMLRAFLLTISSAPICAPHTNFFTTLRALLYSEQRPARLHVELCAYLLHTFLLSSGWHPEHKLFHYALYSLGERLPAATCLQHNTMVKPILDRNLQKPKCPCMPQTTVINVTLYMPQVSKPSACG